MLALDTWTTEHISNIDSSVAAEAMGALSHKIKLFEASKSLGTPMSQRMNDQLALYKDLLKDFNSSGIWAHESKRPFRECIFNV